MMQDEKERLIALFTDKGRWCQGVDARNESGFAVRHNDTSAVSWDIVGGACHLFGWKRACQLFGTMSRHFVGRRIVPTRGNNDMRAMSTLLDFNDDAETTHDLILEKLHLMPVWHGKRAFGPDQPTAI